MHSPLEIPPRWQSVPATSLIIALALVVAAASEFLGKPFVLDWLAYTPVEFTGRRFELVPPGDQYWRYITPVFVHFGLLHLLFNCLWIWEFGWRIELGLGWTHCLGIFLAGAIVGNGLQFWWSGPSIFGGLSGVVYAFMGALWWLGRVRPGWLVQPPPAIFTFMWLWLLVGFTGVLEIIGFGAIANGAHFGGLLAGLGSAQIISSIQSRPGAR